MTDAKGAATTTVESLDGEVAERRQAGGLETTYSYGPFGEVAKVEAPDGSTQTMSYDVLGRRTRHSDPSNGIATTDYNGFGETVRETNGAQEATEFVRDKLGRVEKVTSPDGTETRTWDTAENGVGQLASATSADDVVTRYAYNEIGQNNVRDVADRRDRLRDRLRL